MQGLRDALDQGKLSDFVVEFYRKRGMDVPDLKE